MLSIGNQTSAWATPLTLPFEYALANGFDAFEWFPDKKPGAGWDESDLDKTQRAKIRDAAAQSGVRLSVHARWQANPLQPESYPFVITDLELAKDLGAVLLNIHLNHEAGLPTFVKAITPLLERVAAAGMRVSIENTPFHSPEHFNELFEILRGVASFPPDTVGMCFDLGHANLCAATRNDYLKFLDRLEPRVPIIHLHLHENWGDSDSHLPLFTGPAGRDDSGIRGLVERLRRRNFSGAIILEQWPQPPSLLNDARARLLELLQIQGRANSPKAPQPGPETQRVSPDTKPAEDGFAPALIAGDKTARSWREKLDMIRALLNAEPNPLTPEHLADLAIYLRLLGTGEIACVEDQRHFRPSHHARIASEVREHLRKLSAPGLAWVARKIYPWLPSSAADFRRAEPLTRIRDIAHRNDIPSDLKNEIKHSLQNKLHRCAGPEDLITANRLLERITATGATYSTAFVEQFKIFHEELKEFFNAQSLDERLKALPEAGEGRRSELVKSFLHLKSASNVDEQLTALEHLTDLRSSFLERIKQGEEVEIEALLLADIGLEEFAFVLLSRMLNAFDAAKDTASLPVQIKAQLLIITNLLLSSVEPDEAQAIQSELRTWQQDFHPDNHEDLLRLKATIERSRRLADDYSDRVAGLFGRRAEILGRDLGVAEHAVRVFCEAETRGHLVFQLSKLCSAILRRIRQQLALPAWDVLVSGEATGRLRSARSLDELGHETNSQPLLVLLGNAEGDEEIPKGVLGIILAHEIPHLSHLGLRARQAGVVFVSSAEAENLANLRPLEGKTISLVATPEQVKWEVTSGVQPSQNQPQSPSFRTPKVELASHRAWIPIEETAPETGGAKAYAARRLAELALHEGAGFDIAPALVIPFGVMENALLSNAGLSADYQQLLTQINTLSGRELDSAINRIRDCIQQLPVPKEINSAVAARLGPTMLMVRSSANFEDLEGMASAGLYDSVGGVMVNNLPSAVRKVWASLWTRRAVLSRKQAGIPQENAHMAVLIQQMLAPDTSFVLHTVNPLSADQREVYVELAVGLGETLVSARSRGTPFRLLCNKDTGNITTLAFANFSQALLPANDAGIASRTVDYSRIELSTQYDARQKLGRRLVDIGRFLEQAFQGPQDAEGAVVRDKIFLVQSRPQPVRPGRKTS